MTLKEVLKPPFTHDGYRIGDEDNWILGVYGGSGKGQEILEFATEALNEKWERDFGEPKRWRYVYIPFDEPDDGILGAGQFECPNCAVQQLDVTSYCPSCGSRLDAPEEKGNETNSKV